MRRRRPPALDEADLYPVARRLLAEADAWDVAAEHETEVKAARLRLRAQAWRLIARMGQAHPWVQVRGALKAAENYEAAARVLLADGEREPWRVQRADQLLDQGAKIRAELAEDFGQVDDWQTWCDALEAQAPPRRLEMQQYERRKTEANR